MSERKCPHCGKAIIDSEARWCAYCWQSLDPEAPSAGDLTEEPTEEPTPPSPAEPEMPAPVTTSDLGLPPPGAPTPPPEPVDRGAVPLGSATGLSWPSDGQRRCTDCGEALYAIEHVCWKCGRRLDLSAPEGTPSAAQAGFRPSAGAATPPPPPPPPAGAPLPPPTAGVAAPSIPTPSQRPMEAEVSGAAWWAFGLGLASVFTCGLLGILGPFAIWLGVGANRRGGGPVAVAGIVFGIFGTLILIVWLLVFALVGYFDVRPPTHTLLPLVPGGPPCA